MQIFCSHHNWLVRSIDLLLACSLHHCILNTSTTRAPLIAHVSTAIHARINEPSRRVRRRVRIGCMAGTINAIRARPLEVQTGEERDGVSRIVFRRRHAIIGELVQWARNGRVAVRKTSERCAGLGSCWVDEAAAFSVWARAGHPEGLITRD